MEGTQIQRFLPNNQYLAAINANAPTALNPFATIADIPASTNIYNSDGTIGAGRVATLTNTLNFVGLAGTTGIGIGTTAFAPTGIFEVRANDTDGSRVVGFNSVSGVAFAIRNTTGSLAVFNNVGIVNITPVTSHRTSIGSDTSASAKLTVTGLGATSGTINQSWRDSVLATKMALLDNGYLGVNIVPTYRFHVSEDADNYMYYNQVGGEPLTTFSSTATITGFRANRGGTVLTMVSGSAGGTYIDTNAYLDFYTNSTGTFSARMASSGKWVFGSVLANNSQVDVAGDIELRGIGFGYILQSPDGTRWKINISNLGVLTTALA